MVIFLFVMCFITKSKIKLIFKNYLQTCSTSGHSKNMWRKRMNLKNMSWHKQSKCVTLYVCINSLPKLDKYHDKKTLLSYLVCTWAKMLLLGFQLSTFYKVIYFLKQNHGVYRGKSKRKEKEILYGIYFDVGIHLRDKGVMLTSDF